MSLSSPDRAQTRKAQKGEIGQPLVLVVEDDPGLSALLRYNLEAAGYRVAAESDGEAGLTAIRDLEPDLVLLDWMLPGLSGLEICRQLRRLPDGQRIAVIMLTAKGEEADRIRGLETGADDYVTKPFSPAELVARVRAALRRARPQSGAERLIYRDLAMDLVAHRAYRGEREIHLGPTEFRLLRFLMENPTRVFSREQLLDHVWGRDIYVEMRTIDVHIRRLRKAINPPGSLDLIRTVRSAGYALDGER